MCLSLSYTLWLKYKVLQKKTNSKYFFENISMETCIIAHTGKKTPLQKERITEDGREYLKGKCEHQGLIFINSLMDLTIHL